MKTAQRPSFGIKVMMTAVALVLALTAFSARSTILLLDDDGFSGTPEDHHIKMWWHIKRLNVLHNAANGEVIDGKFRCDGCTKDSVHLRLSVVKRSNGHDWTKATQGHSPGRIVAVIENLDDIDYPNLNLKSGETGYLWVGLVRSVADPKPTLYKGESLFGPPTKAITFSAFRECETATGPEKIHIVPPGDCSIRGSARDVIPDNALWISCSAGCCQSKLQSRRPFPPD